MAKLGQVQEQTMDEILASIRRMISEGDARHVGPQAAELRSGEPSRSGSNVAKLFGDDEDAPEPEAEVAEGAPDNVVELAIAQAMEDAEAEVRADAAAAVISPIEEEHDPARPTDAETGPSAAVASPVAPTSSAAPTPTASQSPAATSASPIARPPSSTEEARPVPQDRRGAPAPLLSPRSDAVVSGAFNQLATTMLLSGSARTLDDLVEDLLRPMLRSWLDINLPPLVERLVREEIERVARGRR